MAKKKDDYRENFILAVQLYMADNGLQNIKAAANELDVPYMTLYKIMQRASQPTVAQCKQLCRKGGFSANWMLLDLGDKYLDQQTSLNSLRTEMQKLRGLIEDIKK